MGTEKTPLVQKLILGVLTLILVCLIVLIGQNRSGRSSVPTLTDKTVEPAPMPPAIEPEPPSVAEAARKPRALPVAKASEVRNQPIITESAAPLTPVAQPQAAPPAVQTALVNPVRPAPLDIVVHPDSAILQTELCGRVRLEGKPPREIPINMDATCRRLHEEPLTTRHYLVGQEGGLANVLVYIKEGLPATYASPPTNKPVLRAQGCLYEPYVMGVQTGQKFIIQNVDSVLHNFHGNAKNNREFNLAIGQRGRIAEKSFDNPEVFIRFKCDVHPWEFSYMGVVSHPFFSVTDANGVFCLPPGLPHGRYVLAAAHPKAGETLQEIVIQDESPNPIELAFTVQR